MKREFHMKNRDYQPRYKQQIGYSKYTDKKWEEKKEIKKNFEDRPKIPITFNRKFNYSLYQNNVIPTSNKTPINLNNNIPLNNLNNSEYIKHYGNFICNFYLNNPNLNPKFENGAITNLNASYQTLKMDSNNENIFLGKKTNPTHDSQTLLNDTTTFSAKSSFSKDIPSLTFSHSTSSRLFLDETETILQEPCIELTKKEFNQSEAIENRTQNIDSLKEIEKSNKPITDEANNINMINNILNKMNSHNKTHGFDMKFDYRFDANLFSVFKPIVSNKVMKGINNPNELNMLKSYWISLLDSKDKSTSYSPFTFSNLPVILLQKERIYGNKRMNNDNKLEELKSHINTVKTNKQVILKEKIESLKKINQLKNKINHLKIKADIIDISITEKVGKCKDL